MSIKNKVIFENLTLSVKCVYKGFDKSNVNKEN